MTKLTVINEQAKPAAQPLTTTSSPPLPVEVPKPRAKLSLMKTAVVFGCISLSVILALCLLFRTVEASRERRVVVSVPRWEDETKYPMRDPDLDQDPQYEPRFVQPPAPKPTVDPETTTKPSTTTISSSFNKKNHSGKFEIVVVSTCIVSGSCMKSSDCCNGACAWVPGLSLPWCVQIVDKRMRETIVTVVGTVGNGNTRPNTNRIGYSDEDKGSSDSSDDQQDSDSSSGSDEYGWPHNEDRWIKQSDSANAGKKNQTLPKSTTAKPRLPTAASTEKPKNHPTTAPVVTTGQMTTKPAPQPHRPTDVIVKLFDDTVKQINDFYKSLD